MILSIDVGTKNLAYCVIDPETEEIKQWDNISLESDPKNMNKLCMELIQTMDMLGIAENMTTVLIEKQPKINPKMKTIRQVFTLLLGTKSRFAVMPLIPAIRPILTSRISAESPINIPPINAEENENSSIII